METLTNQTLTEIFGEPIHVYTRAQAIADGVLVDLNAAAPDVCRQHYKYPMACTPAVWAMIERAVENGADIPGTVHDLLWMSRVYISRRFDDSAILFECALMNEGDAKVHTFKMICGPGDEGEPVITLMLPDED